VDLWKANKDNRSELLRRASQELTELAFLEPCHYADRPDMRRKCCLRALGAVAQHPKAAPALAHPSGVGRCRAAKEPQVRGIGLAGGRRLA